MTISSAGSYLALEEGAGGVRRLRPGDTIPSIQTAAGTGSRRVGRRLPAPVPRVAPEQVNALTGQLITAFQGQGATISSFLDQAAALTNTLADRDQLIGEVIGNLNVVLGSLGDQSAHFAESVDSLSGTGDGFESRKEDFSERPGVRQCGRWIDQ